ncbi:hypothetical protein [Pseudomonas sp. S32]|uniref:hypothetical protein n=1 Tax=Pseudomonas sp. S32 TaxID=2767448 RepID=UPI00191426EC|nr:DUF962 domain-containing protein [Pseudomonas sp. S32]
MNKYLPHLPAWQWRRHAHNHRHSGNPAPHFIAVPLCLLGGLLVLSGVFGLDLTQTAVGAIALIAGASLQRHSHQHPG